MEYPEIDMSKTKVSDGLFILAVLCRETGIAFRLDFDPNDSTWAIEVGNMSYSSVETGTQARFPELKDAVVSGIMILKQLTGDKIFK